METELPVKDIMTREVVTVDLQTSCVDASRKMIEYGIGGIIVLDKDYPVGIVTERDLVKKIVSCNVQPSAYRMKDVMTSPLITVDSRESVNNAMRKMFKLRIRRLPVVDKNKLVGIVTDTDLLSISAQMGEIFSELIQMNSERFTYEASEIEAPAKGICEVCGSASENMVFSDGRYLCELCSETE